MTRLSTLSIAVLFTLPVVGCENGTPPFRPYSEYSAVLRLTLPEQVVAVPSTDSRHAMEATIPMTISEISGECSANVWGVVVGTTDEATKVSSSPTFFVDNSTVAGSAGLGAGKFVRAGTAVELPLRVVLSSTGTFSVTVVLDANGCTHLQFSGSSRILPPQSHPPLDTGQLGTNATQSGRGER